MKIYIDDIRDQPDSSWILVRDLESAMELIKESIERITVISFDHDLGTINDIPVTSIPIAEYLEELAYNGQYPSQLKLQVHSANPVGIKNLNAIFKSIDRFNENV